MASTINGTSTGNGGLISTGDDSGILNIQTNETTAISIDASQNATFAGKVTSAGALTLASNGTTTAVTIDTSQRVGVGTVTPQRKVSIVGADGASGQTEGNSRTSLFLDNNGANYLSIFTSTSGDGGVFFSDNGSNNGGMVYETSNDALYFKSNNAERMRIASDNRVYITCTSAPSATVSGVRLGNPTEALCAFSSGAVTIETYQLGFYNGNGLVGRISTSGSATTYATSSDYRLKETIAPMTGALAKVSLLKPVTYKWKADGSDGEGFIAHELAEVCPHAVSGEKDAIDAEGNPDYQAVDTSFLVATLTAAIQEQQATINALTARVVALESRGTV